MRALPARWARLPATVFAQAHQAGWQDEDDCGPVQVASASTWDDMRYGRLVGKDGSPYFTLKAGNGQVVGQSQMYSGEKARDNGIESCKTHAPGAPTDDQTG